MLHAGDHMEAYMILFLLMAVLPQCLLLQILEAEDEDSYFNRQWADSQEIIQRSSRYWLETEVAMFR